MKTMVVYENSYFNIDDNNRIIANNLITMNYKIKNDLGLKSFPIQIISKDKAYIGSVIGNICLNDTNLVIYPKVFKDRNLSSDECKKTIRFLEKRTLQCAKGDLNSTILFLKSGIVREEDSFVDVLAQYFWEITSQAVSKSKICVYQTLKERTETIKGHILLQKQLSKPIVDTKIWCKYKQLSDENIYNQLLFWGCTYLSTLVTDLDIKRKLKSLGNEFSESIGLLSKNAVLRIKLPRQFKEYEESIEIVKELYLQDCEYSESFYNGKRVSGFIINMERSFEKIVAYFSDLAARKLGVMHKKQASIKYAVSNINAEYDYSVRPDDLYYYGDSALILDAKYKVLSSDSASNRKPSTEDFYQMISSCVAYQTNEAILVYPDFYGYRKMFWKTINFVNGKNIFVKVTVIDILKSDNEILKNLTEAVKDTLFIKSRLIVERNDTMTQE